MSFRIFAVPTALLQPGDLVWFRGEWPLQWREQIFRVNDVLATVRDREEGIIGHDDELVVNPSTIGLNLERDPFLYQVRIGLNDFLGRMYVRWPSNDFTMQLQDPAFSLSPEDTSAAQRQLIGFLDHGVTKRDNPTLFEPEEGLRFEFLWVRDQLPAFVFRGDAGAAATDIFSKVNVRYLVNICAIAPVDDTALIDQITSGELLVTQAIHFSEIGRRGL